MTIAFVILFMLLILWWLTTKELPMMFGLLLSAGAVRRNLFKAMVVVLPTLAMLLPFTQSFGSGIYPANDVVSVKEATLIILASFASVLLLDKFSMMPSLCVALVGALEVHKLMAWQTEGVDYSVILSTFAAPLVAMIVAALLYAIYRLTVGRSHIHVIRLSGYLRIFLVLGVALAAVAVGINNGALLVAFGGLLSDGGSSLYMILPAVLFLLFMLVSLQSFGRLMDESADKYFDISSHMIVVVSYSVAITLILFSLPMISGLGLTAVPVGLPSLIYAALLGVSLVQRSPVVDTLSVGRLVSGVVLTPLVAVAVYYLLKIVFTGDYAETEELNIAILISGVMAIMLVFFARYVRKQERLRDSSRRLIVTQQQQLYENQKALNALEMKSILSENDSLHSTLELKRKEIINVALGISEQKEFMEKLAEKVHRAAKSSGEEKDRIIAEVEKDLSQRTSFSGEIDEFYTQAEVLHKDFSVKLTEEFPNLTTSERRLATLLRLGFSSKYIATLMNISPKSVEISRYRLRQKLGLKKGDNLINFIKSI